MVQHAQSSATDRIRSEERGRHWVAWVADAGGGPRQSVVVVGRTREEAEERVRKWAESTPQN
jgi:hypothetical protein